MLMLRNKVKYYAYFSKTLVCSLLCTRKKTYQTTLKFLLELKVFLYAKIFKKDYLKACCCIMLSLLS